MYTYLNQHDYIKYSYKIQLRKDSNKIGAVLLFYLIVFTAVTYMAIFIPMIISIVNNNGLDANEDMLSDTNFLMLLNGMCSVIAFFGVTIIYSLFNKVNFGLIYPMDHIRPKTLYHLCAFGLAVCMIANYVSDMLLSLFDLIGIDALTTIDYTCDNALEVILFYLSVSVLPAFVEEFAFRGIILGSLRKYSDGLAVFISALTFGLMHGNFTQIPFAFVVGLILGLIAVKTNSLLPGIIIHFLNNAISVTFTLISMSDIPEYIYHVISLVTMAAIAVLGLTSFVALTKKHGKLFNIYNVNTPMEYKDKLITILQSPTMIIFIVLCLAEAVFALML